MEIYLMQHGVPFPKEQDPEQGLSPEGTDQIRASGRALKRMGISLDAIVCSPKKRSQQTAAIVAEELGLAADNIIETEQVKPMAPAPETVDFLNGLSNKNRVLIAGHLPSVAAIASFLLTEGSKATINFQMGGVCRIDVETLPTHSGVLQWYLTPYQLRLLGV
jgi:phosphohistidine phosphatase